MRSGSCMWTGTPASTTAPGQVQKTHVARLKFPAPATMETWVTDQDGDPVFMVVAEPSDSLAGELRRLLPAAARQSSAQGRRVTVCFDRGGWSPALFADITEAGFDVLTWRKGPAPDLPAEVFATVACTDDRGRAHEYDLADSTVELGISEGPRKGQTVTLRQVTRLVPARAGGTRQIHALTSRDDLPAGEVCWRLASRWREEMVFTQLAKRAMRPAGGGREDVADLDFAVGDDHPVDEQLGQLPALLEGGGGQPGPDGLAEGLDPVGDGGKLQPLLG